MKKAFTLAEDATHVVQPNSCRKSAFTLAEVLVTLGIIGVVAAITMPTLIQNYKNQVYVNQLKKSYSMLEQGFQKMLADEGVERLSDLTYWQEAVCGWNMSACTQSLVDNILSKGFKVVYNEQPDYNIISPYPEDGYNTHMSFADSSAIVGVWVYGSIFEASKERCDTIKSLGGNMCSNVAQFIFDVNGSKGPNKWGRDVFYFILSNEGKVYPYAGKDHALYEDSRDLSSNHNYWKNSSTYEACISQDEKYRYGCAARIMENGWKMDY